LEPALGYVRVSTDEQVLGAEAQERAIRDYAARNGLELVAVYRDVGVSGGVPALERPGFRALVEHARREGVRHVIIYSLDRLGRSSTDVLQTLRVLSELGVKLHSVRRDIPEYMSDPVIARLLVMVLAWAAEYERKMIRERTRQALQAKGVTHEVVLDPKLEAKIIALREEGHGIHSIARLLGVSPRQVRKVLVKHGYLSVPPHTCPRCFARLKYDEQYGTLVCPSCGYIEGDERYAKWLAVKRRARH